MKVFLEIAVLSLALVVGLLWYCWLEVRAERRECADLDDGIEIHKSAFPSMLHAVALKHITYVPGGDVSFLTIRRRLRQYVARRRRNALSRERIARRGWN